MLNRRGFSIVEILFVLSVLFALCLFSISFRPIKVSSSAIINEISLFIDNAKSHAMVYKEDTVLEFNENTINALSKSYNKTYTLKNANFSNHSITYNSYGHIINPKSIDLIYGKNKYTFVFQIGSGAYYVKQ